MKPGKGSAYALAVLLWLGLWELLAVQLPLLAGPLRTLQALLDLLSEAAYREAYLRSFAAYLLAFLGASLLAILLAEAVEALPFLDPLVGVPLQVLRATPVAVLTLILLFFFPVQSLGMWIPAAIAIPVFYQQGRSAVRAFPAARRDYLRIMRVSFWRRFRYSILPQRLVYWRTAARQALGMTVKAGLAAEIISLPQGSLGSRFYDDKLYLRIPELLASAVLVLLGAAFLSWGLEQLLALLDRWSLGLLPVLIKNHALGQKKADARIARIARIEDESFLPPAEEFSAAALPPVQPIYLNCASRKPGRSRESEENSASSATLSITDLTFAYPGGEPLFSNYSLRLASPGCYQLVAANGRGKTTLFRLLTGSLTPQRGELRWQNIRPLFSLVPQTLSFTPGASVAQQFRALRPIHPSEMSELLRFVGLSPSLLEQPVETLSGGMQAALAIALALSVPASVYLLDEAFAALDPARRAVLELRLRTRLRHALLIFVSHVRGETNCPATK